MIEIEKDSKISISKKKFTCELVAKIIKQLYVLIGYTLFKCGMNNLNKKYFTVSFPND